MGIAVPAGVKRVLAGVAAELARCGADVKWVEEENFHLTLKFLGEVEEGRLAAVRAAVGRATAGVEPFVFWTADLGAFPSRRRPRVVWLGVKGAEEQLADLAGRVDRELAGEGFPPEDRPFSAHLTLGRVRSPRGLDSLARFMDGLTVPAQRVSVDEVTLFQSVLGRSGPVYTPVHTWCLSGPKTG